MKIIANQRKRTVLATAGLLALVVAVAGLSLAWMGHPHYRLGGAWIGSGSGIQLNSVYIPLDPEGQRAALRVNCTSYDANTAGLLAAFGADAVTDFVGEAAMISRDTWKWTLVGYLVKQGNPPEICAIVVDTGTAWFTSVNSYNVKMTMAVYDPTADADGDGFPDPGTTPHMTFPNLTHSLKRVPLP